MNNANGLPPDVKKFLKAYLHTDADRQLFRKAWRALANDRARLKFLARYPESPDEACRALFLETCREVAGEQARQEFLAHCPKAMAEENGLPTEIQEFLDTHLHTLADRALFLKACFALESEKVRRAFFARYFEMSVGMEENINVAKARRQLEAILKQHHQNQLN